MSKQRILIVEDEAPIAEVLEYNLRQEQFDVEIVDRGDLVIDAIRTNSPDLILLDVMLPGIDGLEVARRLQREPETAQIPIVMLTARVEEIDRIVGLELGADDYIPKPFIPREVVLRVKAVLRRAGGSEPPLESLEVGGLKLDISGHRLLVEGRESVLTATEFRLLEQLMSAAGRVQTRQRLLENVWGYSTDVDSRTVDTHIRRLRRKLGAEAGRIETVIGIGYRLRP